MTVRWSTIKVGDREARCYLATPDHARPRAGVVIAMHGFGFDATMWDAVHRLHRAGYAVAMPDLFHRQPALAPDVPATVADVMARLKMLRDNEIIADMNAAAELLKSQSAPITTLGVTGFCMGGRVAYLMAAANHAFRAAAVFYGGGIMDAWGDGLSPFTRSTEIGCPVIGFFGSEDAHPSPDDVHKIDAELTRLGKWHEFHMYRDAGHAFQNFLNPDRYRERPVRASWGELLAFFDQTLV